MTDRYQPTYVRMWSDPRFRSFTRAEQLVWCHLTTNQETRTEGLFKLDVREACRSVADLSIDELEGCLARFVSEGMIGFDPDTDLVLLRKSLGYRPCKNSKDAKGIVNRVRLFHRHPFIGGLLAIADEVDGFLAAELRPHINEIGPLDPPIIWIRSTAASGSDPTIGMDGIPITLNQTITQTPKSNHVGITPFVQRESVGDDRVLDLDEDDNEAFG